MREYLKVKIKSLASEARIIRLEERRARARNRRELRIGLADHRRGIIRKTARSSLLAYGFLRDVPYRVMEQKTHTEPDWGAVQRMIQNFGNGDKRDLTQRFAEWKDAA